MYVPCECKHRLRNLFIYFVHYLYNFMLMQFSIMETVICSLIDEFPHILRKNWKNSTLFRLAICLTFYCLALPMTTNVICNTCFIDYLFELKYQFLSILFFKHILIFMLQNVHLIYQLFQGGIYVLELLDSSVSGFPLLFVGLFECIALCYVYGKYLKCIIITNFVIQILVCFSIFAHDFPETNIVTFYIFFSLYNKGYNRFASDIEMMLGRKPWIYWQACWCCITPGILLVCLQVGHVVSLSICIIKHTAYI